MRRARGRRVEHQAGMTLTELLVVVVLIAIIIVPISNALFQGITLPSIDANRSAAAAARSLLTLQFNDDVLGAQTAMVGDGSPGSTTPIACPSGPTYLSNQPVLTLNWSDASTTPSTPVSVVYRLTYASFNASLTGVQLVRTETDGSAAGVSRTMLTGYCDKGGQLLTVSVTPNCASSCASTYGAYEQRVQLLFTMRDGPNDGLNSFSLEAAQRDTCASRPTPGVACGVMSTLATMGPSQARFNNPYMLAIDGQGNIYVADNNNNAIREIAAVSGTQWGMNMTAGNIYTVAGGGGYNPDGTGKATPCGDPILGGSAAACGDGGPAANALLNGPYAVSVDPAGNLYIGDTKDNVIRLVPKSDLPNGSWGISDLANGKLKANYIYTIAGKASGGAGGTCNGPGTSTGLNWPKRVVFDSSGNLYLSDASANLVCKLSTGGTLSTVVSGIQHPMGLAVDKRDNLYIADRDNCRIIEVPAGPPLQWGMTAGTPYVIVGNDHQLTNANGDKCKWPMSQPAAPAPPFSVATDDAATHANDFLADDVAVDGDGNVYISDRANNLIRELPVGDHTQWGIDMTAGHLYAIAGGGPGYYGYPGTSTAIGSPPYGPQSVALDSKGNVYWSTPGEIVQRLTVASDHVFTVAGKGSASGYAGDTGPAGTFELRDLGHLSSDANGNVYMPDGVDNRIREWRASDPGEGEVWTVAGKGPGCWSAPGTPGYPLPCGDGTDAFTATLTRPTAVARANNGPNKGDMYIVDAGDWRMRYVSAGDHVMHTFAGGVSFNFGGTGGDVAVDAAGNIYVADTVNCVVREFDAADPAGNSGRVIAGTGSCGNTGDNGLATSAMLNNPRGIDVAPNGDVYIADTGNNRVRYVSAADHKIYAFAGDVNKTACSAATLPCGDGGAATSALLNAPNDVAVEPFGVYIADYGDAAIRKVPVGGGAIVTVAGTVLSPGGSGDNGSATKARIAAPTGLAFDADGTLYISNYVSPPVLPDLTGGPIRRVFSPE